MMKRLLAIVVLFACIFSVQAQTRPVTDTVGYLKSIYANKNQFIGKPFSNLLDSLKINIVYFGTNAGITSDKSKETSSAFYFIIPEYFEDFASRYIEIYWATPLNADESALIYNMSEEGGLWIPEAKNFYKTGIIREIRVSDDIKNATANPSGN